MQVVQRTRAPKNIKLFILVYLLRYFWDNAVKRLRWEPGNPTENSCKQFAFLRAVAVVRNYRYIIQVIARPELCGFKTQK